MTSKERARLKSQAAKIDPVLQIGKAGITPELTEAVRETFNTRELIKIHILQSCTEEGRELAAALSERTGSEVVQIIGRMIVLYKVNDELRRKKEKENIIKNAKDTKLSRDKNQKMLKSNRAGAKRQGRRKAYDT